VNTANDNQLMTPHEAADLLGIEVQTLATWRCTGRYELPFVRVGRAIRYRRADVLAWIESQTVTPSKAAIP